MKEITGLGVSSFRGRLYAEIFVVSPGKYFPDEDEVRRNYADFEYPEDSSVWDEAGHYSYAVADDCKVLSILAWGAGGAGGSWGGMDVLFLMRRGTPGVTRFPGGRVLRSLGGGGRGGEGASVWLGLSKYASMKLCVSSEGLDLRTCETSRSGVLVV